MSEENNYPFPSFLIQILNEFEIPGDRWEILPFGSGLINSTWKVGAQAAGPHYILQRINEEVFTRPEAIAENMARLGNYLDRHFPDYLFIKPIATHTGRPILHSPEHGWFRLLPFVEGSHSVDTVHSPELAFEAARQFGRFTSLLSDFPLEQLQITLPHFHDLSFRYLQFEEAMGKVPASKKEYCLPELQFL
ncbi:MAG TPA: phosphotransferase, partial [Phnomibacter sp.]|nr:phosphotransferase [Phnomibacter sp.]